MRRAGAKSSASRCGVHIHVGLKSEAGDHEEQTLTNFTNIMTAHEERANLAHYKNWAKQDWTLLQKS